MCSERLVLLSCVTVILLSCIAPAMAQVTFTEDFGSYSPGTPVPTWNNWRSGVTPCTDLTVVNSPGGGAGGDSQWATVGNGEPYASKFMTNPFDVPGRIASETYYVRIDPNWTALGAMEVHFGSLADPNLPGYDPNPSYRTYTFGFLRWDFTQAPQTGLNGIQAGFYGSGGNGVIWTDGMLTNGSWNKIEISGYTANKAGNAGYVNSFKVNNVEYAGKKFDGTSPSGWTFANASQVAAQVDPNRGMNATAVFAGEDPNTPFAIDNISVTKGGIGALQLPASPNCKLPSTFTKWGTGGGIETDGSRYVYIDGGYIGDNAYNGGGHAGESELLRFDAADPNRATTADMAYRPKTYGQGAYANSLLSEGRGIGYLPGVGAKGQIGVCGTIGHFGPVAVRYDINTNTWLTTTDPNDPNHALGDYPHGPGEWGAEAGMYKMTGAGNFIFANVSPSQGGFIACKADNPDGAKFVSGQGSPYGPPLGHVAYSDLVYDGSKWMYAVTRTGAYTFDPNTGAWTGQNNADQRMTLTKWDVTQGVNVNHQDPNDPNSAVTGYSFAKGWEYKVQGGANLPWAAQAPADYPGYPNPPYLWGESAMAYVPANHSSLYVLFRDDWNETALQEVRVQGGGVFIATYNSRDLWKYDPATNAWTQLVNYLPAAYREGDDMAAGLLLTGDTNANGVVDVVDLNNVLNTIGTVGSGSVADTNGDSVVDVVDLNNVLNNIGTTNDWYTGSAPVPEPVTLSLLAVGGLLALRRRSGQALRRRR